MATINTNAAVAIINTNTAESFGQAVVAFNQAIRAWKKEFFAMYGENFDQTEAGYDNRFYNFRVNKAAEEAARQLSEFSGGTYGAYHMYSRGYIYTHPHTVQYVTKGRRVLAVITTLKDEVWVDVIPGVRANINFLDAVERRRQEEKGYKKALAKCLTMLTAGKVLEYVPGQMGGYVKFFGHTVSARGLAKKADLAGNEVVVGGWKARLDVDSDEDYGFEKPSKVRRQAAYNPQRTNEKLRLRALDHARRESEISSLLR